MVQWVKNVTAAAPVTVEVRSLAWCSGLKDTALPQLQLGFNPWSGDFHMPCTAIEKERETIET